MDPWHSQKNTSVGNIFIALFFLTALTNFKMYLGASQKKLTSMPRTSAQQQKDSKIERKKKKIYIYTQILPKGICLQCRRPVFNPWVRKIPGRKNGYPLQYSCPENSMECKELDTTEQITLSLSKEVAILLNLILFIILFIMTRTEGNMVVYRALILKYFLMCKYFTSPNLIEEFSAGFIPCDPCLSQQTQAQNLKSSWFPLFLTHAKSNPSANQTSLLSKCIHNLTLSNHIYSYSPSLRHYL